ncbi:MAG: hypothetical protein IJ946_00335 [Clostridia bacterium]|nr:hypothetical protein [Clostridia bacterium]
MQIRKPFRGNAAEIRLRALLYKKTLNIGRVQTPTLALLADRNNKITFFQKEKYYTVSIDTGSVKAVSERIDNLPHAEEIKAACEHSQAVCVSVKKEQKIEKKIAPSQAARERETS